MAHSHRSRRRGSVYVVVLGVTTIVAIVGLSGLLVARVRTRMALQSQDWAEAGVLAVSATQWALANINTNAAWRTAYQNNVESATQSFGRGSLSWKLVDEEDGVLDNDSSQSVRLYGIGRVRDAVRVYSVLLSPPGMEVLATAAYAHSDKNTGNNTLTVNSGVTLTVRHGPIGNKLYLNNNGTIDGNVETGFVTRQGTIIGMLTVPAPAREVPSPSVLDTYVAQATNIPWASFNGTFAPGLLSPNENPYGPTNPNGVYSITMNPSQSLTISPCRIVGTLVISTVGGCTVTVNGVLWQPPRPDYPTLLVRGHNVIVNLNGGGVINESDLNKNLNPPSTPYNGVSDSDKTDSYPAEMYGLIHVVGHNPVLNLGNALKTFGLVLITGSSVGTINVVSAATLTADSDLLSNPPKGYQTSFRILPTPGTWLWEGVN